ncbi:MAG: hypothetical protein K2I64_02945, partial [Muribaculaceae bacterium]|nr:hypothetical protein [Muribaculaceae bacterium]
MYLTCISGNSEIGEAYYDYDSEGRLYSDSSRDMEKISYAPNDMPMTIFGQHSLIKTQYAYVADGRKLKSKAVTGFRKLKGLEPFADELADA